MIKGIIFDFDGTLFDSMYIWRTLASTYLKSIGYTPKSDVDEIACKLSIYQCAGYYKDNYGVTLSVEEIINGINKIAENYYFNVVLPKPGIPEFLQTLKQKNIKMCIATATDKYLIEAALKRCKLEKYFSQIFTCTSVNAGKDEPVIYREALKHLGCKKEEAVVFEDSFFAAKTAKTDGFKLVGIYDETATQQSELKNIADVYITDYLNMQSFWKFATKNQ